MDSDNWLLCLIMQRYFKTVKEKFEDIKWVIGSSNRRRTDNTMTKRKMTKRQNNAHQTTAQKTKD